MYFLRRRHGRKSNSDTRRDSPPPVSAPPQYIEPEPFSAELEEPAPPKPVVIKKAKRPRIESTAEEDCKPAGTFRSGTLHIARATRSEQSHGKA
jgi:hypothetical protein